MTTFDPSAYDTFLRSKAVVAQERGHAGPVEFRADLKPHAADIARWMEKNRISSDCFVGKWERNTAALTRRRAPEPNDWRGQPMRSENQFTLFRGRFPYLRPDPEWLRQKYCVEHLDAVQISRLLGCDPKTAWEWIRAAGIETRKRGFGHPENMFKPGCTSGFCGRTHSEESRRKIGAASKSRENHGFMVNGVHWLHTVGPERNPKWRGGITPERQTFYRSPEWKACAKAVWTRDNATCRRCGLNYRSVRESTTLDLHHIDGFSIVARRADPDNLVLLCKPCHYWVHGRQNVERLFLGEGHN